MRARKVDVAVIAVVGALCAAGSAHAGVFAETDPQDSPEGVVTIGATTFVSTTPVVPFIATGSGEPSEIYAFDRSGVQTARITVQGERLFGGVQGIAGLASDPLGRVLANDAQGRVLRFTRRKDGSFSQEEHATVPDIAPCATGADAPCSAHPVDLEPLVNEITRLPDGTLLVSDSFQAAVWKVPPRGGEASLLVTDPRLVGTLFGPNGISASPNGEEAVLAVSSGPDGRGALYRFDIDVPVLRLIAAYESDQFPDGVHWVAKRRLYVALSSARAIALVDPSTGSELGRFNDPSLTAPAGIEVHERSGVALVANHEVSPARQAPGTVSAVAIGD